MIESIHKMIKIQTLYGYLPANAALSFSVSDIEWISSFDVNNSKN